MSLLPAFFDWCSKTSTIVGIRESSFGMPAVEAVHLLGLTLLLSSILVLHLRLAGIARTEWPLEGVERQLRPLALTGLTLILVSGMVMFVANPAKYMMSGVFLYKMSALGVAIICQFGVLRRFFTSDPGGRPRVVNMTIAALLLTLWFSVGWAGRAIAFV